MKRTQWSLALALCACAGNRQTAETQAPATQTLDFEDDPVVADAGAPALEGGAPRSPQQIRSVVRGSMGEVAQCAEQARQSAPALAGRVTVRFSINAAGEVHAAAVSDSTVSNPGFEGCVVGVLGRLHFAAQPGAAVVVVSYPFTVEAPAAPAPVADAAVAEEASAPAPSPDASAPTRDAGRARPHGRGGH